MPRVVAIIQARMGSTRLPGKVLKDICGKPMIERVIERTRAAKLVDDVVVAISDVAGNGPLFDAVQPTGACAVFGPDQDVLARYTVAALASDADVIVRVTSDCPLVDPDVIDEAIELYFDSGADYVYDTHDCRTYPDGVCAEVFSAGALTYAHESATLQYDREHVTPYMYSNPGRHYIVALRAQGEWNRPELRLCVDVREDLVLVRALCRSMSGDTASALEAIRLMDKCPILKEINGHVTKAAVAE